LRAPVDRFRPLDFLKAKEIHAETLPLNEDTKHAIDEFLNA
jgi:hypothetical protein